VQQHGKGKSPQRQDRRREKPMFNFNHTVPF
jgi:hypothetical protein